MSTHTRTYTIVDVRKVFENFHADLRMLAVNTGGMLLETADTLAHDVLLFATKECISAVHIQQTDAAGVVINASKYSVRRDTTLDSDRPGNNQWPRLTGGTLSVHIVVSDEGEYQGVVDSGELAGSWGPSNASTDYSHMAADEGRVYSSGTYGLRRESFSTG